MTSERKEGGSIVSRLKGIKHIEIIIAGVAVLVMLLIYFIGLGGGEKSQQTAKTSEYSSNYCQRFQEQLESVLSGLKGVGEARVLISWESSVELILAKNEGSNTSSPVIIQNAEPVILKEIYPKAVGVLIVCKGGNDPSIKVNIIMAVSTLLEISPDKVIVYGMP